MHNDTHFEGKMGLISKRVIGEKIKLSRAYGEFVRQRLGRELLDGVDV